MRCLLLSNPERFQQGVSLKKKNVILWIDTITKSSASLMMKTITTMSKTMIRIVALNMIKIVVVLLIHAAAFCIENKQKAKRVEQFSSTTAAFGSLLSSL
jgi:hypothetical protein